MFVWKKASGEIRKRSPLSSSSSFAAPFRTSVSPSRVVSATPAARVQSTESAGIAAASSGARNSPGLVTMRACSWPVRRPSRTTRLRSIPVWSRRSQARQPLLAAPGLHGLAQGVDALRGEHVLGHVVDQVEAAGAVEAEHELALLVLAERVLELVAVALALLGGHDRLDRRVLEAAEALERVAHLGLLLGELALVGEHLPGRARMRRASARSGPGSASSSSTESASANERFDLVTRARTRSPGRPPRTNTT